MKHLKKYNEDKKTNKHRLDKETMEDLIVDIQDDGINVRLTYAIKYDYDYDWMDFYENQEIENVDRVGWMLELYTEKLVDINGFNKYFESISKIHSLVNRINTHFACKEIDIDTYPDNFTGILVIIEIEPTIQDALIISHSYLKSYEDWLNDYDLTLGEVVRDAISFQSQSKTIEEFTSHLSIFSKDKYTMTWKNITKEGDEYLVHGLAVEEIKFKY
jgi:hypothetical protein